MLLIIFLVKLWEPWKVRLIDVGFISDKGKKIKGFKGTGNLFSPQMYEAYMKYKRTNRHKSHDFIYNECVDIFSLGICFLILIIFKWPCDLQFGCAEYVEHLKYRFVSVLK